MTRQRARSCVLVLAIVSAVPAVAHAHPADPSFRLGLGIPGLAVTHMPGSPATTTVQYGLYPATFGVHLGWQIVSEVGLEVRLLGGGLWLESGPTDQHIIFFSVAPRFEYMFTPHETVAPYLGFEVGLDVVGNPDTNMSDIFRTGGFFGIHIFAVTEFSVDLELQADFLYNVDTERAGFRGTFYVSITGWLDP
jgi:hypothetical protein